MTATRNPAPSVVSGLSHGEMTKHIRRRIKAAGIKARVRKYDSCGAQWIQVNAPAYGVEFTEDEQREIRLIAKVNRLTWSRGLPIDTEQMTNPDHFAFCYGGPQ